MKVGKVLLGAARTVESGDIGRQLNQIPGDEPRCKTQVAQKLHEQPGRVPAGAAGEFKRLLRQLDAGVEPNDIPHIVMESAIEMDQRVDGPLSGDVDRREILREPWSRRV